MIIRTVKHTVPPQVEYALTELEHSLSEPVYLLGAWVEDNVDKIKAIRQAYDLCTESY
jgi:DNA-binding HxlR family transcriptional regulator